MPGVDDTQLLEVLNGAYQRVKATDRNIGPDDLLVDDLEIESLDAIDILTIVEDELGATVFDTISERFDRIRTVGDFINELRGAL